MAARPSVLSAFTVASVLACVVGPAAAHEPPFGSGVYSHDTQLVLRTSRGLVVGSRAEFRFVCNEALGVAEFDMPSVLVQADGSLLVGTSTGLKRLSADLCTIDPVLALGEVRVSALVRDPHDSTRLYAATGAGLYESRDEGESFTLLDAHVFDSLEADTGAQDEVFATGTLPSAPGHVRAYFARWQRGHALELQDFELEANEFGLDLLGSDSRRVFAVAHAYLGTQYPDRLLVSSDSARTWQASLSAPGIAALLTETSTEAPLVGSALGLWRVSELDSPSAQLATEAVSCLARVPPRLYMCDGAGAQGGVSESTDDGAHWRSVLRWNQLAGLAACSPEAPSVQLCQLAWEDWQRELPRDQPPANEPPDGGALAESTQAAPVLAPRSADSCAAVSGVRQAAVVPNWLWLALLLILRRTLHRLQAKRSHMTTTRYPALFSLAFFLLSACAKDSSGSQAGPAHGDAGPGAKPDAGAQLEPNVLEDGGRADAAAVSGEPGPGSAGRVARAGSGGAGNVAGRASAGDQAEPPPAADAGLMPSDDGDSGPEAPENLCTSCGACEETQKVVSTMHTNNPVSYADPPPTSGPHNPCWARWGIHDEPLRAERWVHNMEHGGVVFLYNCPEGCDAEVTAIKNISSKRSRTIVAAYPELPARFGVVAWGHRLVSDCFDEEAFVRFYVKNFDHAPESNANAPNPTCPP